MLLDTLSIDVDTLAKCVLRAQAIAGGKDTFNEIYWHTREKSVEIMMFNGLPIGRLINRVESLEHWILVFKVENLEFGNKETEPYWSDVAHPTLLIQEVMEVLT